MLSVSTLWTVIVINFMALGLIWGYVTHFYPKFEPSRYWMTAAILAASGSGVSMLREVMSPLFPLAAGGGLMILSSWIACMGVARFYNKPVSWSTAIAISALSSAGLTYFLAAADLIAWRIVVYSFGQSIPILVVLPLLLGKRDARPNPGARLTAYVAFMILGAHVIRSGAALLGLGGPITVVSFNGLQAVLMLLLVFLAMAWNFGCLLMAIDRLRSEVADLALLDDLTGVANRRHLLQRLTEECARSERSGEVFSLLVIDLDGFKAINDTYGHAAGDACLQHFTAMAQSRLRAGDMLARTGGDEFCVVLPSSSLLEGGLIAHGILEASRQDAAPCAGKAIPIAMSIGVAEWDADVGRFPDRLIARADRALYAAKKNGKNRFAVYDPVSLLPPDPPGASTRDQPARTFA